MATSETQGMNLSVQPYDSEVDNEYSHAFDLSIKQTRRE